MARKAQIVAIGANDNVIADTPVHSTGGPGVTVGTSSGTLLAAPTTSERRYLLIVNNDAANPIFVRLDGAAATADANSLKIDKGQSREWAGNYVPNGLITAISTGAAVQATVVVG